MSEEITTLKIFMADAENEVKLLITTEAGATYTIFVTVDKEDGELYLETDYGYLEKVADCAVLVHNPPA